MTTSEIRGTGIALPGDAVYAAATQVFNLAAPVRPAAATTAHTVEQVQDALGYARDRGMPVLVHTTGHASAGMADVPEALLIRTQLAGEVEVDTTRRVARVLAGTGWGAVIEAVTPHGLTAPHGSSPLVGVIGYLLRGGLSFYGRRLGLAANCVRAVELVTADGRLRRVDASADPGLLWALRGGGGGFGVVTAVEVGLTPVAKVITGAAFWPAAHADRLLSIWLRWARHAPEEAPTSWRIMRLPVLPGIIPDELSAGPVVCVDGAVMSQGEDDLAAARRYADELLKPLRSVAAPLLDSWHEASPQAVLEAHLDPPEPVPSNTDHMLLHELDEAAATAWLGVVGPQSASPLVDAELRQLGGAFAVARPDGGVLNHLDARYAYVGAGLEDDPSSRGPIEAQHALVRQALRPWDTGRTAPTFAGGRTRPQGHLSPEQAAAVDRVRARVDPSGLFRHDIVQSRQEGARP